MAPRACAKTCGATLPSCISRPALPARRKRWRAGKWSWCMPAMNTSNRVGVMPIPMCNWPKMRKRRPSPLPQGAAKIRELAARLKQGYVQIDTLSVTGHTDRLGSDAYNQALSEKRALAVKQFLREQGIANVISAYGKGKSVPVAACDKVAPRAALIACLQPNRRVEIELTGIKSVPRATDKP